MFDFDFDFGCDYTMIIYVVLALLVVGGGYYYYSRSRKSVEKHVDFDVTQNETESLTSKDEYVCDSNVCSKKE